MLAERRLLSKPSDKLRSNGSSSSKASTTCVISDGSRRTLGSAARRGSSANAGAATSSQAAKQEQTPTLGIVGRGGLGSLSHSRRIRKPSAQRHRAPGPLGRDESLVQCRFLAWIRLPLEPS